MAHARLVETRHVFTLPFKTFLVKAICRSCDLFPQTSDLATSHPYLLFALSCDREVVRSYPESLDALYFDSSLTLCLNFHLNPLSLRFCTLQELVSIATVFEGENSMADYRYRTTFVRQSHAFECLVVLYQAGVHCIYMITPPNAPRADKKEIPVSVVLCLNSAHASFVHKLIDPLPLGYLSSLKKLQKHIHDSKRLNQGQT